MDGDRLLLALHAATGGSTRSSHRQAALSGEAKHCANSHILLDRGDVLSFACITPNVCSALQAQTLNVMQALHCPTASVSSSCTRSQAVQPYFGSFQCRCFSNKDTSTSASEAETEVTEDAGSNSEEEASTAEAALQKMIEDKDQMVRRGHLRNCKAVSNCMAATDYCNLAAAC